MGNPKRTASYGWQVLHVFLQRAVAEFAMIPSLSPGFITDLRIPSSAAALHLCCGMGGTRRFVYVLKNTEEPPRYYTGLTSDFAGRLIAHNQENGQWSARHRPWKLDVLIEFADEDRAVRFEQYLKSGSGFAFASRHLR